MGRSPSCGGPKKLEFISVKNVNIGLMKDSENDQVFSDEKRHLHVCFEGDIHVIGGDVYPSTAEAIVHLYRQCGVDFLQHLYGPYTLIVIDEQKGKVLIARDKVGERPLFYLPLDGNLIFASEIKSLLQLDGFKKEIDSAALNLFLAFSYVPAPLTIFKGIKKLPPSCFIECSLNGKEFGIKQYWDPSLKVNHGLDEDAWAQIIYNDLVDSTKIMLQKCKAPLGVLLSGGIDSSIIAAILRKLVGEDAKIMAFTSSFSDPEYDETFYAKKVAEHLNLDHHIQAIESDRVPESLPTLAWFFEEPFGGNAVAHFFNMKFAGAFTSEVFNGDGGDEAFYYPFFQEPRILNYCRRFRYLEKVLSLRITSPIAEKLTNTPSEFLSIETPNLLEHLILERISFFSYQPLELKRAFGCSQLTETLGFVKTYVDKAKNLHAEDFSSILGYVRFRVRLPDCIIRMTYCTSSAASLKVRSPFLDAKFMDTAFSIPSELKLRNGKAKYILLKMAEKFNLLPKEVVNRQKMGFPVPFEIWLREDLRYLIPQMAESEAIKKHVSQSYVRKLIKMFESSTGSKLRYPYAYNLWALIMFWKWYETYIQSDIRNLI